MRFLLWLFAILAAFLLLRSLLEPVVKAVVALLSPPPERPPQSAPPPRTGELKKDPVCGAFVAPEIAVTQKFGNEIVHFCSQKCRDEYARTARA